MIKTIFIETRPARYLLMLFLIAVAEHFATASGYGGLKGEGNLNITQTGYSDSLALEFITPPGSARPQTWWHWINGHVTREGITRDLEAMKNAGLGGFTLFNTSEGTPAAGPVKYMSEEWLALVGHTIREAKRLGLEMGIHNGAGWSASGGPWVTPDLAMQEVVWTEKQVSGPQHFNGFLEIPEPALGIERDMKRDPEINKRYYVAREKVRGYYHDIVLLAFPTLKSDNETKPFRLEGWWEKAGFAKLKGGYSPDLRDTPVSDVIDPNQILILSSRLDSDGRLTWEIPPGDWTILRIGYQPTGRQNHPAPPEGRGLEIDKLSAAAVDFYWKNSIAKIIHAAGDLTGTTFKRILIDSYEVGHQNWNVSFAQDFQLLRGYDLTKFLPALTGRVVGDIKTTEQFLWDFRKTISDLIIKNYYGRFAELSRQSGLTFATEAYGAYGNTDDFLASGVPDIPMAEWWAFNNNHAVTAKLAASAAHTYGRKIVDSEAFTGPPNRIFEEHPNSLKAQGDYFFTQGINRYSFHAFVHDPYNKPPGLGLGTYGSRFDSRNTWWPFAGAWLDYVARCQYLLQQGSFVADLLYYTGEDAPQEAKSREELFPQPLHGFQYDFCTREILEQITVHDGRLVLPGGMSYRVLVLPNVKHMLPEALVIIEQLVAKGAVVVGPKPALVSGQVTAGDQEPGLKELAARVWGNCDGESVTSHSYGKGKVYWGESLESVFSEMQLPADFSFYVSENKDFGTTQYPGNGVEFIHRKVGETDLYFISNQHHQPKTVEATFRIENQLPELWNPETGEIEVAPEFKQTSDGRMVVTLKLDQSGSVFVVFRQPLNGETGIVSVEQNGNPADVILKRKGDRIFLKSAEAGEFVIKTSDGKSQKVIIPSVPEPLELSGPWQVSFPAGWGAPEQIQLPKLISWSEHNDPGVKYFSGTAVYRIQIDVPAKNISKDYKHILDLGDVQVIAEVLVNGKSQGLLWKAPYKMDVTNALKPGKNELEIKVANLWVNRLIGDNQYPDDCEWTSNTGSTAEGLGLAKMPEWVVNNTPRPTQRKAFVAWKWPHLAKKELLPSGLLGPVRLITEVNKEIK